jgi:hypothetical protein
MAKGVSAGPVDRLMGVSPCLIRGSVVEKLLALRADFCGYNLARGSRSAIWYSSGWFLQWHEGPARGRGRSLAHLAALRLARQAHAAASQPGAARAGRPAAFVDRAQPRDADRSSPAHRQRSAASMSWAGPPSPRKSGGSSLRPACSPAPMPWLPSRARTWWPSPPSTPSRSTWCGPSRSSIAANWSTSASPMAAWPAWMQAPPMSTWRTAAR